MNEPPAPRFIYHFKDKKPMEKQRFYFSKVCDPDKWPQLESGYNLYFPWLARLVAKFLNWWNGYGWT